MEHKFLYIAIILTVGIAVGSLISLNNSALPTVQVSDKLIHLISYLLLSLSWLISFSKIAKSLKVNALIFLLILLYGIIIEVFQGVLTIDRQFDFFDILANLVGIILAFTLFFTVSKKIRIK